MAPTSSLSAGSVVPRVAAGVRSLLGRRRSSHVQRRTDHLITHVRRLSETLQTCSTAELTAEAASLRGALHGRKLLTEPETLVAAAALAVEALRRSHAVELYDVQILAALQLPQGRIVQMQTGEGKTFVAIAGAAMLALYGRGVHVMTPNAYLAERDYQSAQQALSQLGLTAGLTPEQGEPEEKRRAYDCDVTYGTGHEFGFDYLRDQLTLRQQAAEPLGHSILAQLEGRAPAGRVTMQRGLKFGIVDEADSVMLDDAVSPLVLSQAVPGEAADAAAHQMARQLAADFQRETHFHWDESSGLLRLTEAGRNRCYDPDVNVPSTVLLRPWTSYVEQALRATFVFLKDIHYVIGDQEVRIVDQTTGRIFEDRSWQDGLHQAIEAKEELPITPEKAALARISRQRFFRLYDHVCGMTGTAVGCEEEFQHVYRCPVTDIPLHRSSQRQLHPTRFFRTRSAKLNAIAAAAATRHKSGQPVLIGTQSIADSEALAEQLERQKISFRILNGLQDAEEAEIVAQAGQLHAITIATNLAGRGTDIDVPPDVAARGGLHVIVAECQLSGRMDRQLIGRSARQGQPGSAQVFVSAEDHLITRFGPWLAAAIHREADADSEAAADFSKPLQRLQRAAEKQQYLARTELLRSDTKHDALWQKS